MYDAMELKGVTAIVTGSSGRLGRAIGLALGQAGCNCVCHYNRNRESAEELAEQIRALGQRAFAVQADLSRPEQIEKLFAEAAVPQILVNSAAAFSRQPLAEVTFQEAQRVLNLNLIAPILTSQYFAKVVMEKLAGATSPVGKIVNIADVGGIRPWAKYISYCSSKAGLIGATKALAVELAPAVCVNAIAPGIVTWPDKFSEAAKKRQLSLIPVGRIAGTEDVTSAVIFLLENDYITGQVLRVDGGRCI